MSRRGAKRVVLSGPGPLFTWLGWLGQVRVLVR
jgi:hypothetical protein